MSNKNQIIRSDIYDYMIASTVREADVLRRLREETASHPMSRMQIAPEQGQFMAMLVQLLDARRTIEVGVFTGYSSLVTALALPPDGRIIACDVSEEWTSMARRYWLEAGVADKIDLRLRPASETLQELIDSGQAATFDFAFIDADKENYGTYYEQCLVLLRPGGLVAVDNVLWSGRVLDPTVNDVDTTAIRAFNEKLKTDERIALSMLPVADGLTLAMKR